MSKQQNLPTAPARLKSELRRRSIVPHDNTYSEMAAHYRVLPLIEHLEAEQLQKRSPAEFPARQGEEEQPSSNFTMPIGRFSCALWRREGCSASLCRDQLFPLSRPQPS